MTGFALELHRLVAQEFTKATPQMAEEILKEKRLEEKRAAEKRAKEILEEQRALNKPSVKD